jgi:hypothetical protein
VTVTTADRRAIERQRITGLRRELAATRERLRVRKRKLRAAAKRYRRSARARVRAWYQAELAKLRAERARRLRAIGEQIARRVATLKEAAAVAKAEKALTDQLRVLDALRAVRGGAKGERAAARRAIRERAAGLRRDTDDTVIREIEHHDPALLPVWRKVGRTIKPKPRESLPEAFFRWVHDNAEETIAIQADAGEQGAERLIRDLAEQEKAFREAEYARDVARLHVTTRGETLTVRRGGKRIAVFALRDGRLGRAVSRRSPADLELAREAARRYLAKLRRELAEVPF